MIRKLELNELDKLYKNHIKKDFPPMERPPCFVIKNNIKKNVQEGFIYVNEDIELGYVITSKSEDSILLFLFAIFNGNRGNGAGTEFLREIIKYYNNKKAIIAEVERPEDAKSYEGKIMCEKRILFYERLGFTIYKDIDYTIFGIPMYLMAYSNENLAKEDIVRYIKAIYGVTLSKQFQNMLKIK
ncbi:MAG: GNAT family N-acetyltransferase [Oscillospiraceae bacterium]|nr:GNAT family N-acetyltransferase [Oscillospiraceae bacterium]